MTPIRRNPRAREDRRRWTAPARSSRASAARRRPRSSTCRGRSTSARGGGCPAGPVRASTIAMSARWAPVAHVLRPSRRQPSPSGVAVVVRAARSVPAPGSLNSRHHAWRPVDDRRARARRTWRDVGVGGERGERRWTAPAPSRRPEHARGRPGGRRSVGHCRPSPHGRSDPGGSVGAAHPATAEQLPPLADAGGRGPSGRRSSGRARRGRRRRARARRHVAGRHCGSRIGVPSSAVCSSHSATTGMPMRTSAPDDPSRLPTTRICAAARRG